MVDPEGFRGYPTEGAGQRLRSAEQRWCLDSRIGLREIDAAVVDGGVPVWGIEGAAGATAVAPWAAVATYWLVPWRPCYWRTCQLSAGSRLDLAMTARLLRFGSLSGIQSLLETAGFTLLIRVVGRLGAEALVATNLAFNRNGLVWMPIGGLATAPAVLQAT